MPYSPYPTYIQETSGSLDLNFYHQNPLQRPDAHLYLPMPKNDPPWLWLAQRDALGLSPFPVWIEQGGFTIAADGFPMSYSPVDIVKEGRNLISRMTLLIGISDAKVVHQNRRITI